MAGIECTAVVCGALSLNYSSLPSFTVCLPMSCEGLDTSADFGGSDKKLCCSAELLNNMDMCHYSHFHHITLHDIINTSISIVV